MQKLEPVEIDVESTLLVEATLLGWTVFPGFYWALIFCLYLDESTSAPPVMLLPIPEEK